MLFDGHYYIVANFPRRIYRNSGPMRLLVFLILLLAQVVRVLVMYTLVGCHF